MSFPILAAAMLGAKAYTQYQEGKQQAEGLKANAEIAAKNAAIAETEGRRARAIAGEEAREKRKEKRALLSRQIVLYAKSGVKAGVGTPRLVGRYTDEVMEKEAAIIQERGMAAFTRGMSQAGIFRTQQKFFKKSAKAVKRATLWKIGSTLATGFTSGGAFSSLFGGGDSTRQTSLLASPAATSFGSFSGNFSSSDFRQKIPLR